LRKGEVPHLAGQLYFDGSSRSLPRWRAWGHIDWSRGPWSASYAAQDVGSFSELVFPVDIRFDPYMRKVESAVFHDIERATISAACCLCELRSPTSPTRIRRLSITNERQHRRNRIPRCWDAPISSSCAMHFGGPAGCLNDCAAKGVIHFKDDEDLGSPALHRFRSG
jgi:hypothetical protein